MNIEEIKSYITKIHATKIDDLNVEEYIDFTLRVMQDFDIKDSKSTELLLQEYYYLMIFFHKYVCKQYGNKVSANFKNNISNNYYDGILVNYAVNGMAVTKNSSIWDIYVVFHENRHAVQDFSYTRSTKDILSIEPLTILMLKEILYKERNQEMYNQNHSKFIFENDANLVTDSYLIDFITKYCPNNHRYLEEIRMRNKKEKTNFSSKIYQSSTLTDFEFDNKIDSTTLPVFYEVDRYLRNINIDTELIQRYPMLEFIYHKDGRRKTYDELMADKERFLKENKGKEAQVKRSSVSEYKERTIVASSHINSIYDGIIKSDPLLHIEESLKYGRISVIEEILTSCPQLLEIYKTELRNLFVSNLSMDNYSNIENIFSQLGNSYFKDSVDKNIERVVRQDVQKIFGIGIDYYISPESETIKSVEELDNEVKVLYSKIEEKIKLGELREKQGLAYQKIILKMYDKYKQLSKTQAKSDEPNQEEQNNNSMQARAKFAKFIRDIELWYKKRDSYVDGDEEDREYIDKVINDQIEYANQLLSQGIEVDMIINNFNRLYQEEIERRKLEQMQNEQETVERTGKLR